ARKGERRLAFPTVLNTSGTRGGTRTASRATRSERREEVPGRLPVLALLEVPVLGLPRGRPDGSREAGLEPVAPARVLDWAPDLDLLVLPVGQDEPDHLLDRGQPAVVEADDATQ